MFGFPISPFILWPKATVCWLVLAWVICWGTWADQSEVKRGAGVMCFSVTGSQYSFSQALMIHNETIWKWRKQFRCRENKIKRKNKNKPKSVHEISRARKHWLQTIHFSLLLMPKRIKTSFHSSGIQSNCHYPHCSKATPRRYISWVLAKSSNSGN